MRIMDSRTELLELLRGIAASLESIASALDDIAGAGAYLATDAQRRDDDPDQPQTMYLSGKRIT